MIGDELRWVVAWSRIFADHEMLCAINTDADDEISVHVTVDHHLSPPGVEMACLFSTDSAQVGVREFVTGTHRSALRITVPAGGFVVFARA